jgi:serine protease AprX
MPNLRRPLALSLVLSLVCSLGLTLSSTALAARGSGSAQVAPALARVLRTAPSSKQVRAFVHLEPSAYDEYAQILGRHGLTATDTFDSIDAVFATGAVGGFRALVDEPALTYLEDDHALQFFGDTAPWATRARVAHLPVSGGPYYDADHNVIDGRGVGVAIIDSGIFALHPDFAGRIGGNFKIVCTTPGLINTQTEKCFGPSAVVEAEPDSDTTGGHGTHVAGIVAGDGTASNGTFKGVAPGATLFGFGTGEGISVFTAAEAFQYILDHYDTFVPRIRVINNSWGDTGGTAFKPNSAITKLVNALVAKGVTVTFSAGNDGSGTIGSTGTADETSSYSKNPTPGVISVGNYWDSTGNPNANTMLSTETGTPNGSMDYSSSRGKLGAFETYPDIAAPGAKITSTCVPIKPVCDLSPTYEATGQTRWSPYYSAVSGTSMAAPHVAGVAALLYQARPDLTAAQVEDVLQDSARKFTSQYAPGAYEDDPQNPGGTISFDKGAGLVNVPAALAALGTERAGVSTAPVTITTDPAGDAQTGAADITGVVASAGATGVTYKITVADVTDVTPAGVTLRITQNVDGLPFRSDVSLSATGVTTVASSTAPATSASIDAATNTVSFFVPYANMGNPPTNAPAHNVFASAFEGLIVDAAPGGPVGFVDVQARPQFGAPYTVNTGADTDPTTSPSPSSSPTSSPTTSPSPSPSTSTTTPPPPSGGRGTYPATPNDPFFGEDPTDPIDLDPTQWGLRRVNAPAAWQEPQATGFGVKVAVIDSGVDLDHEDLKCPGKIETVPGSNYIDANKSADDDNGHGTHVAGIIGACTNNDKGVAGVAPDATIVPFKVLDDAGDGNLDNAALAVRKAADSGVAVINMSLGSILGPASGVRQPVKALDFMDEAVAYAQSKGVVVVAAAGNDSGPLCEYPSAIEGVLCVGATDARDAKSWYSTFPAKVDGEDIGPAVVAPGGTGTPFCDLPAEDILSTYAADVDAAEGDCDTRLGYTSLNGTSMASPHVAGVAALVYDRLGGVRSAENAQEVIDAITGSANDLGPPGYDPAFGYGLVDALAAVRAVDAVVIPTEENTTLTVTGNSAEAGQYSDQATFAARLTDAAGEPIEGAEISFELTGEAGSATLTSATGADGVATKTFALELEPGAYQLTVRYAGKKDEYKPSADVAPFVVEKDDTATTLVVEGSGNKRVARATLADADSGAGLAGRTITFTADGAVIGTAVTDASGTATLDVPKGAKKPSGKNEYVATFAGDDHYRSSSRSYQ